MKKIILAAMLCFASSAALAQSSFTFKDASGNPQTAKSFNCSSNVCPMQVPADSTGAEKFTAANPGIVGAVPGTANGWTPLKLNALTNSAVAIKASAGQLGMLLCSNTNVVQEYVQVFNIASGSVSVGSSIPTLSIPIPAAAVNGIQLSVIGLQFGTAISVAATTTATGGSAPSTALDCNAGYN